MPELPDSWLLESGLREEAIFTIASAYFGTTAAYQDGKVTLLTLVGLDENTEEMTEKISVGADWVTTDGGATIKHPTKTKINKNSIYGHWLQACMEIPELMKVLVDRGNPTIAAIWNDLVLHVKAREITFGRNVNPVNRLMPISFTGVKTAGESIQQQTLQVPTESAKVSPADAIAAARAKAAAAANPNPANPLMAKLFEQAKESSTHEDFMAKAFATDAVLADDDLANAVADPNGIFAQAKAAS